MSKKLIAVVSAAALALTGLVAVAPANASAGPFQVSTSVGQASGTGIASGASALNILVPSQDVLRYDSNSPTSGATTTGTVARVTIQTTTVAATVNLVATAGTKLLTLAQCDALTTLNSTSGVDTLSVVSDSSADAVFCVFTTTTANTTVTATQAGTSNSAVINVRGVSAKKNGYKLTLTATPLTTSPSGVITFKGSMVDMFGNAMTGLVAGDFTATGIGGTLSSPTITEYVADATTGAFTFEIANRTTTGAGAINIQVAAAALADAQTRFGTRVQSAFFATNAVDLSAQVAALTAQVAALTADYNALVTKWNKRVDSRKAPKKKAALK
jgi:hypothetical protein